MRKPLKCLLRLHEWQTRHNPENGESYQVCIRCDAYKEKSAPAPGIM